MSLNTAEIDNIRQSIRRFAASVSDIKQWDNGKVFPRALFGKLAELGVTAISIGEQYGGLNGGAELSAAVSEELSRINLGPAIFISVHNMAAGIVNRHGEQALKERVLPALAAGQALGAFALTEPGAGSDAAALTTTARKEGDDYLLSGEKCYITSAGFADYYVTFAKVESLGARSITAFLLGKELAGITFSPPEKKMGCELSPIASMKLDNCRVPASHRLGAEGEGYAIALSALGGGRINIAAAANGISSAAISAALHHLKDRRQFGRALIEMQGLQFMLADMQIKLDAARLLTWRAAALADGTIKEGNPREASAAAKCFATDAAMAITTDAVQLLGGAGYLADYQVERMMREAKMLQIVEGTNQIQRMIIAKEMINS